MYTLFPVSAYLNMGEFYEDDPLDLKLPVGKLHDGAGELPVPREPVHLLSVPDRVPGVEPICVLKLNGFPGKGMAFNLYSIFVFKLPLQRIGVDV